MSSTQTPVYQDKDTVYSFSVYENGLLAYSKYTFNFELYLLDYADKMFPNPSKSTIFHHFLINNDTDLNKPYSVKEELKKYFNPMNNDVVNYNEKYGYSFSLNYMFSVNPIGYVNQDTVFEHQFELIEYSNDGLRRLQDYIYYKDFLIYYTKYNFDFDTYKNDWNVHSYNKLLAFTDFALRTQYLNRTIIGSYGYGDPTDNFKKYFIQSNGIQDFLLKYSVTSIYTKVYNSFPNIDWENYKRLNPDIPFDSIDGLQEYYIREGQFEQRAVTFIQPINYNVYEKTQSVVSVGGGTGFLYNYSQFSYINGVKQIYLVTCYHIIDNSSNTNVINASVNYYIESTNEQISRTLAFRIIGYGIFTDVLVGLYDPDLDYNKEFNSNLDLESIPLLDIDGTKFLEKGANVYTITNIGDIDTDVLIEGKIMNNNFNGNYINSFVLGIPESYLINFFTETGTSGSPIFTDNSNSCIGIILGSEGDNLQYTIGIGAYHLAAVVSNAIAKWHYYGPLYSATDINKLNFFIKDAWPKRWFGTINMYYSNNMVKSYPEFNNFNDNKGLVMLDFIIGFNKSKNTFVTNSLELDQYDVIPLNTPLLNTKMYERFINNGRVPIVIKSILYFQNVQSDFDYFGFGLNDDQYGFSIITYDLTQIESLENDIKYTNAVKRVFPKLSITYYYYNGNIWVEDTELVGGDTKDWYSEYASSNGYLFYQHRFEFPLTLIPYTTSYIPSMGNICMPYQYSNKDNYDEDNYDEDNYDEDIIQNAIRNVTRNAFRNVTRNAFRNVTRNAIRNVTRNAIRNASKVLVAGNKPTRI